MVVWRQWTRGKDKFAAQQNKKKQKTKRVLQEMNFRVPVDKVVTVPWKRSLIENISQVKTTLRLSEKSDTFPRLRLSASMFFSSGIWCILRIELYWVCLMETNLMISARISDVENPWLMFASAPVLSDPDWMLIIPGRISHFSNLARIIQSWARASHEVMYHWRAFVIGRNAWRPSLFQMWLNQ